MPLAPRWTVVAALFALGASIPAIGHAQTCAMLPPGRPPEGPPAPPPVQTNAVDAAAEALAGDGITVIPWDDAEARLPDGDPRECAALECAAGVVGSLGVDFVVLVTVWAPRGTPTTVVVTLVGAEGSAAGDAAVETDIATAVLAALTTARQRWQASQMGFVSVESEPPGALVEIDDRVVGRTPLRRLVVAGERRVEILSDGYRPYTETIAVIAGEEQSISAQLLRAQRRHPARHHADEPHWVNWIIGGGLVLGGMAALVSPIHTAARNGECTEMQGALCVSRVDFGVQSGLLLGLGLAALAGGVTWLILQPIRVTVEVSPDSASLSLSGTFQ
ncbi:MAG: PEGA domain-containing protein [Sandaracinaceae bacterium]